jgi:hypothetical protein
MIRKTALALLLVATGVSAHANTITQWNFNSVAADASTATGSNAASTGTGSATVIGGVSSAFGSGSANGGSSDPVAVDDTGWQTTGYATQGTGNNSHGVQFNVSTVGFENIVISYDLRHSNTSSRYEQVQYSLDGNTFIDIAQFSGNAGDTWFNGRTVDLSNVAGADNNANFAFRVVATFAPATSAYAASNPANTYATTGTWRFDMATVSGTAVTAVPEPKNYAMFLAGLGLMGLIARRQSKR